MWQYYKACLIHEVSGIKIIEPSGCKLMEHSWYGNADMLRVEKLLSERRHKVIWMGDYAQCAAFVWWSDLKPEKERDVDYKDDEILQHQDGKVYYLINHTRCEYINMTAQENNSGLKDKWDGVIHPLPLLCRADTEEAGGDYHWDINHELQGIRCGDEIAVLEVDADRAESFKQLGYTDKTDVYIFKE